MEGGAALGVRYEARDRVLKECADLALPKNDVGGYAFNDAINLIQELERILTEQMYEDSKDGMLGLKDEASNTINSGMANIHTKRKDVIAAAKKEAEKQTKINKEEGDTTTVVTPEFTASGTEAQDEADRLNSYRMAAIGVKEGFAKGITKIVGKNITNAILRSADGSRMKSVDDYKLHQLWTAIQEGADRPAASKIQKDYVDITRFIFDWRETAATNVEQLAMLAEKASGFGVRIHSDLRAVIILANTEWAAKQSWGAEIRTAQRKITAAYTYNFVHTPESIADILKMLVKADGARDRQLATAPDEMAAMANAGSESRGLARLQELIRRQESFSSSDSSMEEAYGVSDTDDEASYRSRDRGRDRGRDRSRGRGSHRSHRKAAKDSKTVRRSPSRSPSTSRSPTPEKKPPRKQNVTNCKHCKKHGGNGYVHEPPRSIPHDKCNFNKKWKGYRPEWVCERIGIPFKPWSEMKRE